MKSMIKILGLVGVLLLCACEAKIPPLSSNATVLAFGDSLTAGNGVSGESSYPSVLASLSGLNVVNAGVSGEVTEDGLSRLPALLDQHQPELLILCHGGNDFLQKKSVAQVEANIREMIALAQVRNIPVLLLGVPDPSIFLSSADLYEDVARETGAFFLEDIISDVLARPAMKSDAVHPNKVGYEVIATEVFNLLQKMESI